MKVWTGNDFARLATGQTDIGKTESARLLERIEEARAAWKSGASATVKEYLARGERDAAAWVAALKKLGSGAHGLRTAAVPLDTLIRLVEDARAAPADRASAAVAVASDPSARARIRVAAETAASPKLRVALERIADESASDADLASSLEQLRSI